MKRLILLAAILCSLVPCAAATDWRTYRWLYFGFNGYPTNTYTTAGSNDGATWTNIGGTSFLAQTNGSVATYFNGNFYSIIALPNDRSGAGSTWYVGKVSAPTGTIEQIAAIDWTSALSGLQVCFGGYWFQDTGGLLHVFIPCAITTPTNFTIYETHPLVADVLAGTQANWSSPVAITISGNTCPVQELHPEQVGSTFYFIGSYYPSGSCTTQKLIMGTATSLTGTYTVQRTLSSLPANTGYGNEGVFMFHAVSDTTWRFTYEDIRGLTSTGSVMRYADCDSLDITTCNFTPDLAAGVSGTPWTESIQYRHGSINANPNYGSGDVTQGDTVRGAGIR